MKKHLNNPIIVGLLAVAAVAVVGWTVFKPQVGRSARRLTGQVAEAALTVASTLSAEAVGPVRVPDGPAKPADRRQISARFMAWVEAPARDPFGRYPAEEAKIVEEAKPPVPLILSAIWRQSGRQMAVINGMVVAEGDEAFEFKVERVENNVVLVRGPNGLERLEFPRVGDPVSTNPPPVRTAQVGRVL